MNCYRRAVNNRMIRIGILALQGGYAAHAKILSHLGATPVYIRTPDDLADIQGLILPGGESSTALKLLTENNLFTAIQSVGAQGLPVFGTCAGAILMAKHVISPAQTSLGLVDITIERNAYGRQLASRVVFGRCKLKSNLLEMVFIRAPRIQSYAKEVELIAHYDNQPVCIRQNNYLLATFHPELTQDMTLHRYFMDLLLDKPSVNLKN